MHWILKIAPSFLKNWDEKLRISHPVIWVTKIHLTTYLTLLATLVVAIVSFLIPVNFSRVMSDNEIEGIAFVFMIPTIILSGYNIIQLVLFNIGKRNGRVRITSSYITFLIYFISFVLPYLLPFVCGAILNYRTGNIVTTQDLLYQRNIVLKAEYYVNGGPGEYNSFEYYTSLNPSGRNSYGSDKLKTDIYEHKGKYKSSRPRLMKSRRYLYGNWDIYGVDKGIPVDSIMWLYYKEQNHELNLDSAKYYLAKANDIIHLYNETETLNIDEIINELKTNTYSYCYSHYKKKGSGNYEYSIYPAEQALDEGLDPVINIIDARNHIVPDDVGDVGYAYLWVGLYIACIIFVFKWVSWQQFLLHLFITGLYFTVFGVAMAFSHGKSNLMWNALWILIFGGFFGSALTFKQSKFKRIINYLTITSFYAAPLFMVWFVYYLDDVYRIFYIDDNVYGQYDYVYKNIIVSRVMLINLLVFFLLALPYYQVVFKRLNALPRKS